MRQWMGSKGALAMVAFSAAVSAQAQPAPNCPAGTQQLNQTEISAAFSGKTLCMARGTERWQEYHGGTGGGALIDYKLGSGHPVDPTKTVGSWSISGTGTSAVLTHAYTGGGSYSWYVCGAGKNPPFTLVSNGSSGTLTNGVMLTGQVPCP